MYRLHTVVDKQRHYISVQLLVEQQHGTGLVYSICSKSGFDIRADLFLLVGRCVNSEITSSSLGFNVLSWRRATAS